MITYGQEKFISEAIKGVLMQVCSFNLELIIANDCSPDNTDYEIKKAIKINPYNHEIKYTRHSVNLGMQDNFIWAAKQCTGKYIAMCEGDDFWTDPLKIQKQFDFLENNPDFVLCFHKVYILKKNGKIVSDFITKIPKNYQNRDVFLKKGNYIHTVSVMYRNFLIHFDELYRYTPEGDFLLYLMLSKFGKLGYIEQTMAVYRNNVGIISKSKDKYFKNILIVNMIALLLVDEDERKIMIERNIKFALYHYNNLPIAVIIKNVLNIPNRVLKKYFSK
jgi:glycosyltransferase involved in cell wall biosynthesis